MEPQEIFDKVAIHLLTQNKKSIRTEDQVCVYRAEDGCKCAAGVLIPEDKYDHSMEDIAWPDSEHRAKYNLSNGSHGIKLVAEVALEIRNFDLVRNLQLMHDTYQISDWKYELELIAKKFLLNAEILDNVVQVVE